MTDSTQPQPFTPPFDERSALEELEQLADKIQLSRRQRAEAVAEFDAFVRTFREARYASAIAATERERRADDRPAGGAATHAARAVVPVPGAPPASASIPESAWAAAVPVEPIAVAAASRSARPRAAYIGVTLAALAVVAVAVLMWRSAVAPVGPVVQPDPAAVPAASTAPATPIASSPAGPAAAAASPMPGAGPPRALTIELVALRPVWARVTVDGRRAVEREFVANQRMSFGADRAIAVRAGDAGAIRLVVDGKDLGVLGRDGQILSRTFTARTR